ncbi:MAG TPA: M17 family peptidase N-terminal domain-containing protein, partial [Alphaproteobacteria bacterium]|nr:M17 family peptidase N-terminal domain-containing protein [Alphaproteobacteria bacterium]
MNITFAKPGLTGTATLVVGCAEGGTLTPSAARLDKTSGGALSKAVAHARFEGKAGQTLTLMAPAGVKAGRIVLLGLGAGKALDGLAAAKLGGAIIAALAMSGESRAAVVVEKPKGCKLTSNEVAAQIGHGARLRSYRFDKYRTKQKKTEKPSLTRLTVMCLDV